MNKKDVCLEPTIQIHNTEESSSISLSFLKNKFIIYLFILGLRCCAQASHCGGFSCCGAQALGTPASVVVARGLSKTHTQQLKPI